MLNFKRTISALMAVLMLALSFTVAIADDEDREENPRALILDYASGTYQGYSYSFSTANSSSSYLWSRGDYGTSINIKLRFRAQLCYLSEGEGYLNWDTAHTKTYGPHYDTYLYKSYTVSQWVNAVNLTNAPAGSLFRECTFSLLFNTDTVASLLSTFIY